MLPKGSLTATPVNQTWLAGKSYISGVIDYYNYPVAPDSHAEILLDLTT